MEIEMADAGGGRHLILEIRGKMLLKARISKSETK
jgi:hypothetical protein